MNSKTAKWDSKNIDDAGEELTYWWALPKEKIPEILKVDFHNGLRAERVQEQRDAFGANIMEELRPTSFWMLFLDGVKQPMMVLLLSIAAISFLLMDTRG